MRHEAGDKGVEMGSCDYCEGHGNRIVFYTKQITVASVTRSVIGFYVYGAPRPTQIFSADWSNYGQVCPQFSITPTLGARGPANLSDGWRHANGLVNATDPKHPIALPLEPRYERKRVIIGEEWVLVTFEGESGAPTFWLPEGLLGDRHQAGVEFGLVISGLAGVGEGDARWARVKRVDAHDGAKQMQSDPGAVVRADPAQAADEDVQALRTRRLMVLDRKYEFHFLGKDDSVLATVALSPTNPNEISRQVYPKVGEPDSQFIYVSTSVEENFPVLK